MLNAKARFRGRSARLGLLMVLLLALAAWGYRLSVAPSASTGSGTGSSAQVLAPSAAGSNGKSTPPNGTDNCVDPSSQAGNCEHRFGVAVGQTQTLYPGLTRSLPVTFTNPNSFDILVTSYRVSVAAPASKATTCPASNLQVPSGTVNLNPRLAAPKQGSVATTVPIKLSADAPDACQQVTFSITVNASAVKK